VRYLALLACAFLVACGGSGGGGVETSPPLGPPPSGVVYVQAVPPGTFPDARLGEYREIGPDGYVRVRDDLLGNHMLATRTIAHELGHALGFDHRPGTGCIMDQDAYQTPNVIPCPAEASLAVNYPGVTLAVYVGLTPDLLTRTNSAVSVWNQAAGRTILAVQ